MDALQNEYIGPLYTLVKKSEKTDNSFNREYQNDTEIKAILKSSRYSVSKINQLISLYISILWGGLYITSIVLLQIFLPIIGGANCTLFIPKNHTLFGTLLIFLIFAITMIFTRLLIVNARTNDNQSANTIEFEERSSNFPES